MNATLMVMRNCSALTAKRQPAALGDIQQTMDVLMFILSTSAIFLNLFIGHCALRLLRRTKDTIHVYILSMAIADLLVVFGMSMESLDRLLLFLGRMPSSTLHFIGWLGFSASGLSIVLLNSDKLLFFCFPIHYRIVKSVRRAVKLCIAAWFLSTSFVGYVWLAHVLNFGPSKYSPKCSASLNPRKLHIFTIYTVLVCVLPIISSLVVSCHLLRLMRQKRRQSLRAIVRQSLRTIVHATNSASTCNDEEITLAPAFTRKLRSLVFIFTTTVWTASSLLPYRVFVLVQYNLLDTMWADRCGWLPIWMSQLGWLLHYLLKLNPIINPCIIVIIYHPYRTIFLEHFARKFSFSGESKNSIQLHL